MNVEELMDALGELHPDTIVSISWTDRNGEAQRRAIASVVVVNVRECVLSDSVDEL